MSPCIPQTIMHQPQQHVTRFLAEICFDSLSAYAIAPPLFEWNLSSLTSSTFNMTPWKMIRPPSRPSTLSSPNACRLELTLCRISKHTALRHVSRVSTPNKPGHHQHHVLMSALLISLVLSCFDERIRLQSYSTLHHISTILYCLTSFLVS
jgi:hypothetical protein